VTDVQGRRITSKPDVFLFRVEDARRPSVLRWVRYLLMLGGTAALAWCAYTLISANIAQRTGRDWLESRRSTNTSSSATSIPRAPVAAGTPLAELSIPSVGLSALVLEGSDDHTLRQGLGHIEDTAFPGQITGNVAIAGHRDTFFRPLRNVNVGDDVWLDTPDRRARYRVTSTRIVGPNDVDVIGPTGDAELTLVTCYPFYFVGHAPDRFIVRAVLVKDGS
jgi:sortase A